MPEKSSSDSDFDNFFPWAKIEIAGDGKLVTLVSADVTEALSELYTISAQVICDGKEVDFFSHLGTPVSITVSNHENTGGRQFNGILTDVEFLSTAYVQSGIGTDYFARYYYHLTIRPRIYQMAFNQAYVINENCSVVDIVTRLVHAAGVEVRTDLSGTYSPMEYSVQYGESDFTYLSRLLEQSGIYYFFLHEAGREIFHMCDHSSTYRSMTCGLFYLDDAENNVTNAAESGVIVAWSEALRGTGEAEAKVTFFDFEAPAVLAGVNSPRDKPPKWSLADQKVHSDSARQPPFQQENLVAGADIRLASVDARRKIYSGRAIISSLAAGDKIDVHEHPVERYNANYTIVRLHTTLVGNWESVKMNVFDCTGANFEAVPAEINWQPPLLTPVPVARGPETATVLGGENEEIITDEYGRVKVKFHWLQEDKGAQNSCWIRVSQTGGLGNIVLPRAGHEVIVDFLDGNPDRPVIVGRVFNKNNMPVYDLPANKTRALWRSKTYGDANAALEGGAEELKDTKNPGANEMAFEDMSGKEEFFMHAQRNMNVRVRNNSTHHVGRNLEIKVFNDESKVVAKNSSVEIQGDEKQVTKKSRTVEITGQTKINTTDNYTLEVSGGEVSLSSDVSFTLKCGSSKIEMTPSGITISAATITVEAKAVAEYKAGANLTIKGAMVMIN